MSMRDKLTMDLAAPSKAWRLVTASAIEPISCVRSGSPAPANVHA